MKVFVLIESGWDRDIFVRGVTGNEALAHEWDRRVDGYFLEVEMDDEKLPEGGR